MKVARAAAFLLALGWRLNRRRLARASILLCAGCVAAPLGALALGRFTDAMLSGHAQRTFWLALLAPLLLVAEVMLGYFAHLDYYELGEMQESQLRLELMRAVNGTPGIAHLDDPAFADGVALVREALFGNRRALEGVLQLLGVVLQGVITAKLLIDASPWLGVLPLFALAPVWISRKAQELVERAKEVSIEHTRRGEHWLRLATSPDSVKELRLFGVGQEVLKRYRSAWEATTRAVIRGLTAGAALRAIGQLAFVVGYGGAIILLVHRAMAGRSTIGDLVLVITLAVQVSLQISTALQLLTLLQGTGKTVERIAALKMAASARVPMARTSGPGIAQTGIVLENVSFCYPGGTQPVLRDVCLTIPPGSTVALVGENGAGKSTLIKLLCGLYRPSGGRVLVDGVDLGATDVAAWRHGVATLFQDFARFELTLRESIGLGHVESLQDEAAVRRAVRAARAERVLGAVDDDLDRYVGRGYAAGVELSGGQWQTVGLARCLMRQRARLLVLDEPTAALDAAAEHELFDRYATSAAAVGGQHQGVTLLITHRFSTVLMANSIIVLEKGRVVQHGSHRELMAQGGIYAELFRLQARAYRAA